jgi:hypothetical protein
MNNRFPLTVGCAKIQPPVSTVQMMAPFSCAANVPVNKSNKKMKFRVRMQSRM